MAAQDQPGFLSQLFRAAGADAGSALTSLPSMIPGVSDIKQGIEGAKSLYETGKTPEQNQWDSEKQAGYSPLYRSAALVAPTVGVNAPGMEAEAQKGSVGGVLGHTATPLAMLGAGEALGHGLSAEGPKIASNAQESAVPRSLGAAAAQTAPELPQTLRTYAGLERRATPRSGIMNAVELDAAIKNRRPAITAFDHTEGAMDTIKRDPMMPKHPSELLQGGHAGNGVSSVEELSRPGTHYAVGRSGQLTYQGKSFAPEATPIGGAHVTVMPNGDYLVNEGNLTPSMERGLASGANAKNRIY